jgi:hypothetical protein
MIKMLKVSSMLGTAALAGALHLPTPYLPLDTVGRIEQDASLHTHQDGPSLPLIGSKQTVIRTATGEAAQSTRADVTPPPPFS